MHDELKLHTPIRVMREDVENVLVEQSKEESVSAQVLGQLHANAGRAADELNRALAVDIFDVLAQGWAQVPAVQTALQLSALTQRAQTLVNLDRHQIASTSRVVLGTRLGRDTLPPLELSLEISADVQSASLATYGGRIDVVALGATSVRARLTYKEFLVRDHATEVSGLPRDASPERATEAERPATIDFLI